jgi:hypothetical protein
VRAVRLHEHGGPEVLRYDEVPIPEQGPGEVLVRVHAVGITPPDWYLRDGMSNLPPETRPKFTLPVIPGTDLSGVVEAVAADVEGFSVGDEVFGLLRFPGFDGSTYAEYVAAPASDLALKPDGIDHVHAAGAPMAGLTAWQFLIELGHDQPSRPHGSARFAGASIAAAWSPDAPRSAHHRRRRQRSGVLTVERSVARRAAHVPARRGRDRLAPRSPAASPWSPPARSPAEVNGRAWLPAWRTPCGCMTTALARSPAWAASCATAPAA